jgi:hypothetical protein
MNFDTLEDTKERLDNWKRWAITKPHYRVTMSLEGRYKCPQCWEERQPTTIVDINDAIAVERAIISLPKHNLAIIKYTYLTPFIALNGWCRKNRVRADQFEFEVARSIMMIRNILRG